LAFSFSTRKIATPKLMGTPISRARRDVTTVPNRNGSAPKI
jgi:hypothetical protein